MRRTSLGKHFILVTCFGLVTARAYAQDPPAATEPEAPEAPETQPAAPAAAVPETAPAPTPAPVITSTEDAGWQFEGGIFGGLHLFGRDLELGVPDEPGKVSTPKTVSGIFGARVGVNYLPWVGLEGEFGVSPTEDKWDKLSATILHYRLNLLGYILHGKVRPFVLVGVGLAQVAATDGYTEVSNTQTNYYGLATHDTDGEVHGGVGVKWDVTELLALRFDTRLAAMPNNKPNGLTPDWEFTLGLAFKAGGHHHVAVPAPAPIDSDGDGIPDNIDKCPTQAEDKDGFQDDDGCPDLDNDGDGIPDNVDKCPNEAETKNGIDDEDGCPEKDLDGDGLVGSQDKCPNEAEDKDGFEDDDGCPDLDNDKDGIPDKDDKCPNQPETKNGFQDSDGCPDEVPAAVKKFTGVIAGITFKVNSADIQKSSFKLLGQAVKVLKDYPDTRMEISGHTSSDGKREKNIELSKGRAESVKAFLVSAGIDGSRIQTVGYGPDKPIALNKTRKGREQNRRIEFRLLTSDDAAGPTPAAPAGPAAPAAPAPAQAPAPTP